MTRRWEGATVCVIASGPSLTVADCDYVRRCQGSVRVITINDTWRRIPTADVLYAADVTWWRANAPPANAFKGERWSSARNDWKAWKPDDLNLVQTRPDFRPTDREPIPEGSNSAFQAMMLARLWGARKVVFLGLDLAYSASGEAHWHGAHKNKNPHPSTLKRFAAAFAAAAPLLDIEVINASRHTILDCFPRRAITECLP